MRLSDQHAGYVKTRRRLADDEWIAEFHPTSATRRKDPDLPEVLSARLLRYPWPGFRRSWLLTSLHPVDLSYISALTHVKNALLQMLRADTRRIPLIYEHLLHEVAAARIRKRPGRSYPRRSDKPRHRSHGRIQHPAKIPKPLI